MKTDTKKRIIEIIIQKGKIRPHDLAEELGFNATVVHRHLRDLVGRGDLIKVGSPPIVFYLLSQKPTPRIKTNQIPQEIKEFIEKNYLYFTAEGYLLSGIEGFSYWVEITQQAKQLSQLAKEYFEVRQTVNSFFQGKNWINATKKMKKTFPNLFVDEVFYLDFYSLPKFGKTKLGNLVFHAKLSQNKSMIKDISMKTWPVVNKIIAKYQIEAVAFIPHSIPRVVPFLKYFEENLNLSLPVVELSKAYPGQVPIAQKSLRKLEERITNAQNTIFVKDTKVNFNKVLLIDDAVGSGATLNETAKKLKKNYGVKKVYGLAVVGSYKGFEVIREI